MVDLLPDLSAINPRDFHQLLLPKLLDQGHRKQPSERIVTRVSGGRYHTFTHVEHFEKSKQLGDALLKWGLKTGDIVGTLMWNTARHLQAYHAIPGVGAAIHTLNIRLSPRELGYIIWHAADRPV